MVLLRHLIGDALRRMRLRQGRTLREVSASARVSLGYLSEVERGQKEASSELLAAICAALDTPLSQVLREVSDNFALAELQSESVFAGVIEQAIEVTLGHDGRPAPMELSAGQVSTPAARLAAHSAGRVPAVAWARAHNAPRQAPVVRRLPVAAGAGPAPRRPLAHATLPLSEPVYDRVARSARDLTDMVPV